MHPVKALGIAISILIFLFMFAAFMASGSDEEAPAEEPSTRTERIESRFSAWDGSHVETVAYVKSQMNDPSSFEHVKTTYLPMDEDLGFYIVKMAYRGTNAFNATVTQSISVQVNDSSHVIEKVITSS